MPRVVFTKNIQRHVGCESCDVAGSCVRDVLDAYFRTNAAARGYVLDEQGEVRRHMIVFVDGRAIIDRKQLSDSVKPNSEVYVMQALSGG